MSERRRFIALWLGLLALHLLHSARFVLDSAPDTDAAWTGFPLDDAFIHLVYAKSLSLFQGFDYNPGQPEAGFTSPLWTILLAPVFWVTTGLDGTLVLGVKLVGVAVATACSGLVALITGRLTGSFAAAVAAGVLVAVEPYVAFAGVSGMEVALASFTLLLPLWLLACDRTHAALAALALAPLARPESTIVVIAMAPILVERHFAEREPFARLLRALAPMVCAGSAWLLYCQLVTGHPLPSTFYVKSLDAASISLLRGITWNAQSIAAILASSPLFGYGAGALATGLGAIALLRTFGSHGDPAIRAAALASVVAPLAWLAGITFSHRLADPGFYYWSRYVHPVLPLLAVLLAVGLHALCATHRGRNAARRWRHARVAGGGLVVALVAISAAFRSSELAEVYAWNCQNMNEVQVALGRWVETHAESDDVVATVDAGAIRFVGGRHTVDMGGLNSHEILTGGRDALVRADPRFVAAFRGTIEPALAVRWQLVERAVATSKHYTVSPAPVQAAMAIYEVTNRGAGARAESPER